MERKYRPKYAIYEVVQWTGENFSEVFEFMHGNVSYYEGNEKLLLNKLDGNIIVYLNTYILRDYYDNFYVIHNDIIEKCYEATE